MTTSIFAMIGVTIAAMFGAIGSFFFKKASSRLDFSFSGLVFNSSLIVGFLFYGMSVAFFITSLKYGELSVLYPLVATGFIWTSLLSVIFLKEKMNALKWIGVVLIMLGVSLIGFGSI